MLKDKKREDLPVSFCSDEFGNCMRQGRVWVDVKNRDGIFPVVHASG